MLKITLSKTPKEERWILHGRVIGPWVRELQVVWRNTHRADERRRCVFDLNDVTFVDKGGEQLLRALAKQGVQFEASGIYVRDVVKQVKTRRLSQPINSRNSWWSSKSDFWNEEGETRCPQK